MSSIAPVELTVLPKRYGVVRRKPDATLPAWALGSPFFSMTRSDDELSIVCEEQRIPKDQKQDGGWRCLKVHGPLKMTEVGILASLATNLAQAKVCLLAISTHDTDYLLCKDEQLCAACEVLRHQGHTVHDARENASSLEG
jgi:hypothetical protein